VVIESPRGSGIKLKYDPTLGTFAFDRALVLGVRYPFDWGFVPGTRGPDGDPVDAMVLMDTPSYPGVVIPCRALALLELEQDKKGGDGRMRNDRIIATPVRFERAEWLHGGDLTERIRRELEEFFVSAALLERKNPTILGWGSAKAAEALIDRTRLRGRGRSRGVHPVEA
jgi:inorganic pyrophosphatase